MNNNVDVSGCWKGIATSGMTVINYHWCLQQIADEVEGVISLSYPDRGLPGSYRMRGRLQGKALQFQGIEFIENPGNWCMAAGVLHHGIADDGVPEMRGFWGPLAIPGGCPPGCRGSVMLRRG